MGRKKIKITRIADDRNRSVTYLKRKAGLMKKAHELAVLTGSEVAVIVFGQNGKLSEFCSSDMDMLLLRYTEHSGPIERRGPEHYEKDDDDNSDDGAGDDGDDYEGTTGTGGGDADESGRTNSHANSSGRNGSVSGRNQKRKAPGARKDADGQSTSSASSSRRGSSPPSGAGPRITVDGSNAVDDGEAIDRDTLKAAIIQRTLSHRPAGIDVSGGAMAQQHAPMPRPAGVQHHHSFSTGDHILLQQQYNAAAMASFTPQRPNTAGSQNSSGLATPVYGLAQRPSPTPFAFTAPGPSPAQANMFGAPPPMAVSPGAGGLPPSVGQPSRTHSAMAAPESRMTYGDLARGGGNQGGMVPPTAPFPLNDGSRNSLMPLAHPILRQHPQFESYQMQLRTQQQSRNSSVPNIHTAPNSPGNLIHGGGGGQQASHTAGLLATPQSGALPTIGKRSASFGMATSGNGGGLLQSSFASNMTPSPSGTQMNALQSGEEGAGGFAHDGSTPIPMHGLASAYGLADAKTSSIADAATDTEQPISNADFNELMGSILGDMANTTADGDDSFATLTDAKEDTGGGGTAASAAKPRPIPARPTSGAKDEYHTDDLMQSLDSEHSLSTLVNSDSFEGIFKAGVTDVGGTANNQKGVDDFITHDLSDEALP